MKNYIIQTRLLIAEKLLNWAFDIAPKTEDGYTLKSFVYSYFKQLIVR